MVYLESLAWAAGVRVAVRKGHHRLITVVDNEPLFYAMMKGRCTDQRVSSIIRELFLWCESERVILYPAWIDTLRMPADAPSRGFPLSLCEPPRDSLRIARWPCVCAMDV